MTTTSTATNKASALPELVFADGERIALAGFLAGYRGSTRDAYALDLRQFVGWCERRGLRLFAARRADIELYARYLEEAGRPVPPWPEGFVLLPVSTVMQRRKGWCLSPRRSMSAGPGSTTSPTPSASTATR